LKIRDDAALGQHSHVGMARTANEDFFGYWESDDDRTFDLKGRLAIVCDGMGGHAGGEIASRLAVKTIIQEYQTDASENVMEALRRCIEAANSAVFAEASKPDNELLKGMGTTVTAIVHRREVVYFGQVGDSRAYLIRGNAIRQMTKDHSLVQQLVDEGLLEESEMENHPDKNVILRSLGVKPKVEVDISYAPLAPGDIYLLCSDGLSGLVSNDEMLSIVRAGVSQGDDLRQICERLIDLANQYGGHDNITVQLLRIDEVAGAKTNTADPDTVTAAFTADEIEASIAKARADAAARKAAAGGNPGSAPSDVSNPSDVSDVSAVSDSAEVDLGKTKPLPVPDLPKTNPEMPVPVLEKRPRQLGGGVMEGLGPILLGVGFVAGLLAGMLAMALFGPSGPALDKVARDAEAEANAAANVARQQSKSDDLLERAEAELKEGQAALSAEQWVEAHARFRAARSLFHAAGGRRD
jgi:protein phosphatase